MEREIENLEMTAAQLLASRLDENQRKLVIQLMSLSLQYLEQSKQASEFTLQSHELLSLQLATQRRGGSNHSSTSQH